MVLYSMSAFEIFLKQFIIFLENWAMPKCRRKLFMILLWKNEKRIIKSSIHNFRNVKLHCTSETQSILLPIRKEKKNASNSTGHSGKQKVLVLWPCFPKSQGLYMPSALQSVCSHYGISLIAQWKIFKK